MALVPLPPGVHKVTNIKGSKGEKGDTGTFAYAEAVTLAPTEPATVELIGTESNRGVRFGVPAGAGGSNAVPDDEAISNNIEATYTLSHAAVQKVAGAEGFAARSIVGEVPAAIEWPSNYPVRPSVRITDGDARGSIGWSAWDYFDLFSEARGAPANTFYVNRGPTRTIDGVEWGAGHTSNDGLSPATPRTRLGDAIALANNAGGPARIYVASGYYRYDLWQNVNGNRVPESDVAIIAVGGTVIAGAFIDGFTVAESASYSNCYEITLPYGSTTARMRVVDRLVRDADGVEWDLYGAATAEECDATPGSYFVSSSTLLLHRADYKVPSVDNTFVLMPSQNMFFSSSVNVYLGSEGNGSRFKLVGGQTANIRIDSSATLSERVVVIDSTQMGFAGHGESRYDALTIGNNNKGLVACFDCEAVAPMKDGFNLHTDWSTSGSRPALLTVNCRAVDTGRPRGGSDTSNNALTLHERATGIDIAGDYRRGRGAVVHNIGSSKQYMIGTTSADDLGDVVTGGSIEPTSFMTNDNAEMFLEAVRAGGRSTDYAFNALGASQIHLRDVPRPGMRVGGNVSTY